MAGILINPKAEVLRLGSSTFRSLPLWGSCYELSVDVCRVAESHPDRDSELMKKLARTALDLPLGLARTTTYRLGVNYLKSLKRTFIQARQMSALLLLAYELDYLAPERFADLNTKTASFTKELKGYIRVCQGKVNRDFNRKMFKN